MFELIPFLLNITLIIALICIAYHFICKSEKLETELGNVENDLDIERKRNEMYQKDMVVLIENSSELRTKMTDIENNLEVVVNSLPDNIKELARPGNQN